MRFFYPIEQSWCWIYNNLWNKELNRTFALLLKLSIVPKVLKTYFQIHSFLIGKEISAF